MNIHSKCEDSDQGKNFAKYLDFGLMEKRTVVISEAISSKLTKRILSQLLLLNMQDPKSEILLYLNSPGGSADDGFAIFDTIQLLEAPVKIICTGLVASAGTIILCSASKENRVTLQNTRIMMHQPSSGMQGTASDIKINAQEIVKLRAKANLVLSKATGQTIQKLEEDTNRDYWLNAQEALEYGLVSKIISNLSEVS